VSKQDDEAERECRAEPAERSRSSPPWPSRRRCPNRHHALFVPVRTRARAALDGA